MQWYDNLKGKELQEKIEEYSEVYGEVLVGLHSDVENHSSKIEAYGDRLQDQDKRIQQLEDKVLRMMRLKSLYISSYVFVLGVGVVVCLMH